MPENELDALVQLAMELQSIAQNGLTYTKDPYDKERFARVRDISAQIMNRKTGLSLAQVKDVFCNETSYQTPKIETRRVVFAGDQILLVKERGLWALPGGWIDYNGSVASNTVKEVKEEAGLDVTPVKIIALQDRNKHNHPPYAYGICKVFILCRVLGGSFQPNIETTASGYFALNALPELDAHKTTREQVEMCFAAYQSPSWETMFD